MLKLRSREHPELVEAGSTVRVDSCRSARNWRARVTYVSGEIVGLRGPAGADEVFSPHDPVTLHVRSPEISLDSHARVLATGCHTMRVLAERGLVAEAAAERRAAPRIHATPFVLVTAHDGPDRTPQAAQVVDLSVVGCAIRSDCRFDVGTHVTLTAHGRHGELVLAGEIVRAWRAERTAWFHAGIQFDPMPAADQAALQRFLLECIHAYDLAGSLAG